MSRVTSASGNSAAARRWGKKLAADVAAVMSRYPDADPEDVRLMLISLQSPPFERLIWSLRSGRGFVVCICCTLHARVFVALQGPPSCLAHICSYSVRA